MLKLLYAVFAGISSYFISGYLNLKLSYLTALIFFVLMLIGKKMDERSDVLSKGNRAILMIFSCLFSLSIVLGDHIHVEDAYSGTIEKNYMLPFDFLDLIAAFFIAFGIYELIKFGFLIINRLAKTIKIFFMPENKISIKLVVIIGICIFAAWLPYLIVYYPGYIFGDTLYSILQAIGSSPLDNHHPVFYTLFIKACLKIGNFLGGGNTLGCAIYCLIQMLYMSICISYVTSWLYSRFKLSKFFLIILLMFYGITPYFAQLSIAMWKDPIFSTTLAVLTVLLADIVLKKDVLKKQLSFWLIYVFLLLVLIFVRNNGIYIAFFMSFMTFAICIMDRKNENSTFWKRIGICTLGIVVGSQVIIGPVYDKMGIRKEKVESYGIFLNQMARVAAYDGNMSEDDKEYMDQLLSLELYKSTYTPCCVDLLKWNQEFNAAPLEKDFFKTYFSMLIKNPGIFFEGWMFQTYGYWTVNCDEINEYYANITSGVPRNLNPDTYQEELNMYGIELTGHVTNDLLTKIFPATDAAIPIGVINWGIGLLFVFIVIKKQKKLLIPLAPSIGLIITLVVASPISYWPRYAAAEQYLIPFYTVFCILAFSEKTNIKENQNG